MSEETGTPGRTEAQAYKSDPVSVESPTPNHKEYEKQLNAEILITQQQIVDDLAGIVSNSITNVRDFGAVGDGVTDDIVAIQAAVDSAPGKLFFPKGIYKITSKIQVTQDGALEIIGDGCTAPTVAGESVFDYTFTGSAIYMSGPDNCIIEYNVPLFKGGNCAIRDIMVTSDHVTTDQHALLFSDHAMNFNLDNVIFMNVTGYCWCWNMATNPYSQNIKWEGVSAYTIGGVIGHTAEPTSGARIDATLFSISNFNLDHQLSSVSPQDYICDFRGIREIALNNFLLEGASGGGVQRGEYMIFDGDGPIVANNVHLEGLDADWPDCWFRFTNSPFWYSDSNVTFQLNGFFAASLRTINFEANSKAQVHINGFTCLETPLTTIDNWIIFTGGYAGASIEIENLDSKQGSRALVPATLRGKVVVKSNYESSANGLLVPAKNSPLFSQSAPLFRWRPDVDGAFDGIQTPYGTTVKESTYATDVVTTFENTRVHHFNQSGSRGAFIGFQFALPAYLVGATITMVARMYFDGNADRFWELYTMEPPNTWDGTNGIPVVFEKDDTPSGNWVTYVCSFVATDANLKILSDTSAAGTGSPDVYLASYDIYLGTKFHEPWDLRT